MRSGSRLWNHFCVDVHTKVNSNSNTSEWIHSFWPVNRLVKIKNQVCLFKMYLPNVDAWHTSFSIKISSSIQTGHINKKKKKTCNIDSRSNSTERTCEWLWHLTSYHHQGCRPSCFHFSLQLKLQQSNLIILDLALLIHVKALFLE